MTEVHENYADLIDSLGLDADPRHIEGVMRCGHPVLSGLDRSEFIAEARVAAIVVREIGPDEAEATARTWNL